MKMEARNKCMRKIFGEAQFKIYEKISKDRPYYRKLLEDLVTQVKSPLIFINISVCLLLFSLLFSCFSQKIMLFVLLFSNFCCFYVIRTHIYIEFLIVFPRISHKNKTKYQGLIKLWEKKVVIQCLERDVADLESVLESAKKKFKDLVMKEMNLKFDVSIQLNKKNFLTPREPHDHSRDTVRNYDVVEEETINKNEEDRKW